MQTSAANKNSCENKASNADFHISISGFFIFLSITFPCPLTANMDEEECRLIHHTKDNYEDQPDTKDSKLFDESSPKLSPWHHGWKLSTLFLGIIAVVQFILLALHALAPHPSTIGSYATGFTTEFDSAKPHISLEQHRFGSALHRNPNGTLSRLEGKPGEMAYVGRDTEATNRAWDNLIARRYFILDDKEINQFNSDELSYPDLEPLHNIKSHTGKHGVFAGVEMLHSLHCLDSLRRQLDGQPGHGGNNEEQKKMHIGEVILTGGFLSMLNLLILPSLI